MEKFGAAKDTKKCPKCGAEMAVFVNGEMICPECDKKDLYA